MPDHIILGDDVWGNNMNNKRVAERHLADRSRADGTVLSPAAQAGSVPPAIVAKDPGAAISAMAAPVTPRLSVKGVPPAITGAVQTAGTPTGTGSVPEQTVTTPNGPTPKNVPNWTPQA